VQTATDGEKNMEREMMLRRQYVEEHDVGVLRKHKGSHFQTCKKAGLFAFIISVFFTLILMGGCTAEADNAGAPGGTDQSQSTASADEADGSGFIYEDTATVEVKIEEEGR